MAFSMTREEGRQILTLEGSVTVRDARNLAAAVTESYEEGTPLAVETGKLEDIDTCILQYLCSLRKTVDELSFENPPEAFLNALDRRQLRHFLLGAREDL